MARYLSDAVDVNIIHHWLDLIYEQLDRDRGEEVDVIKISTTDSAVYALNLQDVSLVVYNDVGDLIDRTLSKLLPSGKLSEEWKPEATPATSRRGRACLGRAANVSRMSTAKCARSQWGWARNLSHERAELIKSVALPMTAGGQGA